MIIHGDWMDYNDIVPQLVSDFYSKLQMEMIHNLALALW